MADFQSILSDQIKACAAAASVADKKTVGVLVEKIRSLLSRGNVVPSEADAITLVKAVRKVRLFSELVAVGGLLSRLGVRAPLVRRYMAQGLVDSGQFEAGIAVAEQLAPTIKAEIDKLPADKRHGQHHDDLVDGYCDTLALIGRAHKDIFASLAAAPAAIRETALRNAIGHYMMAFQSARPSQRDFPGTNVMALLTMAKRDGLPISGFPTIADMAGEVRKAATLDPKRLLDDPWAASAIAEAHLARGELAEAAEWFGRYAYHPKVDAFMLGGTIRQLEAVWGLKAGTKDAEPILAALKARLLSLEGGTIELSPAERRNLANADASDFGELSQLVLAGQQHHQMLQAPAGSAAGAAPPKANLEKTLTPTSSFADFRMMLIAVRRGQAVARICSGPGITIGTGFLVQGSDICPMLGGESLILTNAHVVSRIGGTAPGSAPVAPSAARIYFDIDAIEGEAKGYACELVWESPVEELDAALLRPLPGNVPHPPLRVAPQDVDLVPERGAATPAPPTRLLIIGHPYGGALQISVEQQRKSTLMEIGTKPPAEHIYLHYRTPTEPGMSGSPVLHEETGTLIGLHHAGPTDAVPEIPRLNGQQGGIRANEGVLIHSICRAVTRSRAGGNVAPAASAAVAGLPPPPQAASAPAVAPPLMPGNAPPRITYAELVARLADPRIDNKTLAPYFLSRPEASGPYQPAFAVNPQLVDTGQDGTEAQLSSVPGLVRMMNKYCSLDRRARARTRLQQGGDGLRFVSEGDSWFEYPILIDDVIDHLDKDYTVFCLAAASDTLENMISEENFRAEIEPAIEEVRPHGFLLSAGGNDVVGDVLQACLKRYDPRLMPGQYLNGDFGRQLLALQHRFALAFNRLLSVRPQMKILVHGYDMRGPVAQGPWLGRYFEQLDIVDQGLQRDIITAILDRVAGMHHALERGHPGRVHFVDTRRIVPDGQWFDELHPNSQGFVHVANRFREKIEEVFGKAAKTL